MEIFSGIGSFWQTWAVDPLSSVLTFLHDAVGSYAIAIILFTVAIRLLMIPLTVQQIRSQRKIQMLQPEINKVKKKYKNDRQAQSQALIQLYKQRGANPMSGCLPIFVQLPVLLALYGGILTLSGRGLLNEQFLWFNLGREDATIQIVGESAPTEPVDVHFASDQEVTALESAIATGFAEQYSNYQFVIDSIDPDQAAQALTGGAAQAVFLDNPLDTALLPGGVSEARLVQAAAFVVERDRSLTRLTQAEVERILRGELTNWADLGGAPGPIVLHGILDDIGSRALLSDLLLGGEPIPVRMELHDSVDSFLDGLRSDPNGLGLASPIQADDIRMVNIQAAGATRAYPPIPTVLREGNYALVRDVYAYWAPSAGNAGYDFLLRWWESGLGQVAAGRAGFTRLPAELGAFGAGGFYISLLALLAGAFQFMQARMMQQRNLEGQAATANRIMQFMPLMVVFFAWSFQSGLVLYWVVSSIISIIQQYFTTGTGRLVPAHWPIARDVMAEHRPAVATGDGADENGEKTEAKVAASPRRRRRRRRRRG